MEFLSAWETPRVTCNFNCRLDWTNKCLVGFKGMLPGVSGRWVFSVCLFVVQKTERGEILQNCEWPRKNVSKSRKSKLPSIWASTSFATYCHCMRTSDLSFFILCVQIHTRDTAGICQTFSFRLVLHPWSLLFCCFRVREHSGCQVLCLSNVQKAIWSVSPLIVYD